jgi:hypothetical protein
MSDQMEIVLRRSLDEVDRSRKWQWVLLVTSFCILVSWLVSIADAASRAGEPQLFRQIMVSVLVSMLTNVLVVLGLGIFITRMTKRILKAIELIAKG